MVSTESPQMVINIVLAEFDWKIPIVAATTAPNPIRIAPPKAEATPAFPLKGDNDAAVAFGFINPTTSNIAYNPPSTH